jgi:ribosomal-protein-alanine N-acetyltransferase
MARLVGPRVALLPVPQPIAAAVVAGRGADLAAHGLVAGRGWPHDGTVDLLRHVAGAEARPAPDGAEGAVGTWLVCVDGTVVGECGWRGAPDADGAVEISYGLAAPSRRQGLGTEAVGLLAAWAERQSGVRLVTAEVLPGNEPSLRVLARLGFYEHLSQPPYLRMVRPAPGQARPQGRQAC